MTSGYIYLIQEREFISTNRNVFKIGMTSQSNTRRLQQYPKNSKLICYVGYYNITVGERELLQQFRDKFISRKDIGSEYFEGDPDKMFEIISEHKQNNDISYKRDIIEYNTEYIMKQIDLLKNILTSRDTNYIEKISETPKPKNIPERPVVQWWKEVLSNNHVNDIPLFFQDGFQKEEIYNQFCDSRFSSKYINNILFWKQMKVIANYNEMRKRQDGRQIRYVFFEEKNQ